MRGLVVTTLLPVLVNLLRSACVVPFALEIPVMAVSPLLATFPKHAATRVL
jgi:hypothetical protein